MNKIAGAAVSISVAGGMILAVAPSSHATTPIRSKAMAVAAAQKGDPYQWGATGPDKFDCSGLVLYSYKRVGKTLPRTAQSQYNKSRKVSASNRRPGDLVAIGYGSSRIYHIGIFAGVWKDRYGVRRGWMWDAPHTGSTVGLHPIYWYTKGAPHAYYGEY